MDRGALGLILGVAALLGSSVAAAWGGSLASPSNWGRGSTDARPESAATAQRIVSATLTTDELLLEMIGDARLAGLSFYADDPAVSHVLEAAGAVEARVRGEAESILALDPDLVFLAGFTRSETVALLESAGAEVLLLPPYSSLAEIRALVRWAGAVVGNPEGGERLVAEMDAALGRAAAVAAGREAPRVLFWEAGGYTWGVDSLFDELLAIAGGRNAAAELGIRGYAALPLEDALALDPEVVVYLGPDKEVRAADVDAWRPLANDPVWRNSAAVRTGRVHPLTRRDFISINHHVGAAAEELAAVIHGQP